MIVIDKKRKKLRVKGVVGVGTMYLDWWAWVIIRMNKAWCLRKGTIIDLVDLVI